MHLYVVKLYRDYDTVPLHCRVVLQTSGITEEEGEQVNKKEVSFDLNDEHAPEGSHRMLHGQWNKAIPGLVEEVHTT